MENFVLNEWRTGSVEAFLNLKISTSSLEAEVNVDSRTARELSFDVLANQAPYLAFQPPNDQMKEMTETAPSLIGGPRMLTAVSNRLQKSQLRWPKRAKDRREDLNHHVDDLLEEYSMDEILSVLSDRQ